ncbi:MAG: hypothetical protein R3C58_05670 [Parvularculaceae bacterium]
MIKRLRIRSVESLGADESKSLKRSLGALDLTLLGIGCIIGTGVFVLTGVLRNDMRDPASLFLCARRNRLRFAALVYAELAAMVFRCRAALTHLRPRDDGAQRSPGLSAGTSFSEYAVSAVSSPPGGRAISPAFWAENGVHLPTALMCARCHGSVQSICRRR